MSVSPLVAAKHLCAKSNWRLTNLQLQKLLYIAHMRHLGVKKRPLVDGAFEAWDYGPVHPEVYRRARPFGAAPVQNVFHEISDFDGRVDAEAEAIEELDLVYRVLGQSSAASLVAMTHWAEGAWAACYRAGERGIEIPNSAISLEYKKRVEHSRQKS